METGIATEVRVGETLKVRTEKRNVFESKFWFGGMGERIFMNVLNS